MLAGGVTCTGGTSCPVSVDLTFAVAEAGRGGVRSWSQAGAAGPTSSLEAPTGSDRPGPVNYLGRVNTTVASLVTSRSAASTSILTGPAMISWVAPRAYTWEKSPPWRACWLPTLRR